MRLTSMHYSISSPTLMTLPVSWLLGMSLCISASVLGSHVATNTKESSVRLNLKDQKLVGTISPHVTNLSFLRSLNIENKPFSGGIPSEVGHLIRLQNLNLSYNSLEGEIPVNLSHCSNLLNLDLQYNNLVQQIPSELGSLSKLEILSLLPTTT
jgi:Leucine-rich repeat (LRR) protein